MSQVMSHQYFLLLPLLVALLSELTCARPGTELMISSTLSSFCHDSVSHRRHGGNACFSLRLEQTDYPEFGPFRTASKVLTPLLALFARHSQKTRIECVGRVDSVRIKR
jgi:hypothetical protein